MILLLFGLLLLGLATALGARAVALPRLQAAERLGRIEAYGFGQGEQAEPEVVGLKTVIDRLAERIGRRVADRFDRFSEADIRSRLMAAGIYGTPATTFLGYQVLTAGCSSLGAVWLTGAGSSLIKFLFVAALGAYGGWMAPMLFLRRRAEQRLARIDLDLPELIDLLVVTVEAGLGFSGSLQIASGRLTGPLGDELRLTLQEQRMGLSTNEALSNMLARCDTPAVRSFVRSVLQGETLGVSIGNIMRNLSTEMRKRRRHAAEERAQKAPIKMLFPLVFLIFPPMFIVLLYPALYSFGHSF